MKIINNVLTVFSFILILASTNNLSANTNTEDWKVEIMSYLTKGSGFNGYEVPDKILVDFILNEKGEIVILSTSFPELDKLLKSKLNYKKLGFKGLKTLEKYTLPIVFDKK